jgi:hypothetical protein
MAGCYAYAFAKGSPRLIATGWDYDQRGCGHNQNKDYPSLYWPEIPSTSIVSDVKAGYFTSIFKLLKKGVCVKTCPGEDASVELECFPTSWMTGQAKNNYKGCSFYPAGVSTGLTFRYATKQVGGFCLPDITKALSNTTDSAFSAIKEAFFNSDYGMKTATYFYDIMICWPLLLISLGVAIVLSYIFLYIMRCLGGMIVWLMILLTEASLIAGGIYCWYLRSSKYTPEDDPTFTYLAIASYVLWGIGGLLILLMFCCCSAIRLGIALMKAAAKFVAQNLRILIVPLISNIFIIVWCLVWFWGGLYLYTVGYAHPRQGMEFMTEITWDKDTKPVIVYYIFGLFWVNGFLIGATQFIIAAAAVIWYFDQGSDKKHDCVGTGIKWVFRYHLGTIAFGSMIIAICQTIRIIFEYYRRKIQSAKQTKNVKAILCMTSYLLFILEKFIKFITKNAYIQCAVSGENFCTSAWNAFTLMIKNAARFGWGNSIGAMMVFFSTCGVGSLTAFGAYIYVSQTTTFKVSSPIPPALIVGFIACYVAWIFFSVLSFAIDALLQAFLLDEELRFAGKSRPVEFAEF